MKLLTKWVILFGLVLTCSFAAAADNFQYISAHKAGTTGRLTSEHLNFVLAKAETLFKNKVSLRFDYSLGGATTTPRIPISGRLFSHTAKDDSFLIQDINGIDLIFDSLADAQSFRTKFLDIVDYSDKENIHFYTSGPDMFTKVPLAVLYRSNGDYELLFFPNRWFDVGATDNAAAQVSPF